MRSYAVIVSACLFILSILFLFLVYVTPFNTFINNHKVNSKSNKTTLYFKPKTILDSCLNTTHTVPIYLSSLNRAVNTVQIELLFDPEKIYNVMLLPATSGNYFGEGKNYEVTLQEVREMYGRASLAVSLKSDKADKTGNKPVAILTFTTSSGSASSRVLFLEKSTVNATGSEESVLTDKIPLTIYCVSKLNKTSTPSSQLNSSPAL